MIFVLISCISFMVYHYLHYGIVVCAQDLRLFIILNNVSCESNPVWLPIKHVFIIRIVQFGLGHLGVTQ